MFHSLPVFQNFTALLVSGKTFIGSGWYADGNDEHTWRKNLSNMATAIAMQAKIGDNQVMPYGLSSHFSATEQRAFMDEMQQLGVKVHHHDVSS